MTRLKTGYKKPEIAPLALPGVLYDRNYKNLFLTQSINI
jgi:hypothetical protein